MGLRSQFHVPFCLWAAITILMGTIGCASDHTDARPELYSDQVKYQAARDLALEKGVTSKQDVMKTLGWPLRESQDGKVFMYSWQVRPGWEKNPIRDLATPEERADYVVQLVLEFDTKDVLLDHRFKDSRNGKSPFDDPIYARHPGLLVQP